MNNVSVGIHSTLGIVHYTFIFRALTEWSADMYFNY